MPYRTVSAVWKNNILDIEDALKRWTTKLPEFITESGCDVFFRADDIGFPGKQFSAMTEVFKKHKTPLALAVVPCWVNERRINALIDELKPDMNLWCIHQHGYRHINTEITGKKFEFGPSRDEETVLKQLKRGRVKLESLLEDNFCPIFTPPWNRCSAATMKCLVELKFKAISRSINVKPCPLDMLPDLPVSIDLHTRKEKSAHDSLEALLQEMTESIKSGTAGFMLHHQRMNHRSIQFLDILLPALKNTKNIRLESLRTLA